MLMIQAQEGALLLGAWAPGSWAPGGLQPGGQHGGSTRRWAEGRKPEEGAFLSLSHSKKHVVGP